MHERNPSGREKLTCCCDKPAVADPTLTNISSLVTIDDESRPIDKLLKNDPTERGKMGI